MTRETTRLSEGELVAGRFRVGALLGRGGMGEVYEAQQLSLDRVVALKVLHPEAERLEEARGRFVREARVAAALRHRHAVEVYDFGEDRGRLFLAMERLRGPTLSRALAAGELAAELIVDVTLHVATVLVEAHRLGLVHRDLTPGNIFLEPEGEVLRTVVADFGLAFIPGRRETDRMTRRGILTGTPAYLSPEQALGHEIGSASDVYSFGCTVHAMVRGAPPFEDESDVALVTKHLFAHPPSLGAALADRDLPHALEGLVLRMVAKRPEDRPSAEEVLEELSRVGSGRGRAERGRGGRPLAPREQRMIPENAALSQAETLFEPTALGRGGPRVGLVGSVEESLRASLAANGLNPVTFDAGDGEVEALYAPGATAEEIVALQSGGCPLVTDASPEDMERIASLLGLGVADAVPRPVRGEELARRLWRVVNRRRRSEGER